MGPAFVDVASELIDLVGPRASPGRVSVPASARGPHDQALGRPDSMSPLSGQGGGVPPPEVSGSATSSPRPAASGVLDPVEGCEQRERVAVACADLHLLPKAA